MLVAPAAEHNCCCPSILWQAMAAPGAAIHSGQVGRPATPLSIPSDPPSVRPLPPQLLPVGSPRGSRCRCCLVCARRRALARRAPHRPQALGQQLRAAPPQHPGDAPLLRSRPQVLTKALAAERRRLGPLQVPRSPSNQGRQGVLPGVQGVYRCLAECCKGSDRSSTARRSAAGTADDSGSRKRSQRAHSACIFLPAFIGYSCELDQASFCAQVMARS